MRTPDASGVDANSPLHKITVMPYPILITGGAGYLGTALRETVTRTAGLRSFHTYHDRSPGPGATDFHRLDIADETSVRALLQKLRPEVVIHAAATMNPEHFDRTIIRGSETVARVTAEIGAVLLHISSDMVFDGRAAPYDESAMPSPITDYGRAKARAEEAVLRACPATMIVRTSLLYSLIPIDPRTQRDIDHLASGREVMLFTDEKRSAAEVHDVADAIIELAAGLAADRSHLEAAGEARTVNIAGPEPLTRWQLGSALFDALGVPRRHLRAATIAESGLTRPRDLTLGRSPSAPGSIRMRSLSQVIEEFETDRR
jgi:dTDP-4-dehydrorhamnose reductase